MGWVIERHGSHLRRRARAGTATSRRWWRGSSPTTTRDLRPGRESAWIAEVDGARAGCIFCCQRDPSTAQLRILLVEPWARGLGIGSRLVEACTSFAADAGYDTIVLWTNDVLVSARRIYEAAGFRLVDEERHHSFGHDLVGQHWELALR